MFAVNTDGSGFTNLYGFGGSDGATPTGGLTVTNNILYGTTSKGGTSDDGTIFKIDTDGSGFSTLYSFSGSDGDSPGGGNLVVSGTTLYGTTAHGGDSDFGTVFKVHIDGTGLTILHSFTAWDPNTLTNADGVLPDGGLILSGNTVYGTASGGGSSAHGTVFTVNTDGTGFTTLYSFTAGMDNGAGTWTNSDGATPHGLVLTGNTLYGTAGYGGSSSRGTVFAVKTDASAFTVLHAFNLVDGANPEAGLVLSGNTLYGTAFYGGSSANGTIFSISLPVTPPQLTITPAGSILKLSWPTNNATGFYLQDTVTIGPSPGWITTTLPFSPIILNGQYVVTIPTPPTTQHFYRLSQ